MGIFGKIWRSMTTDSTTTSSPIDDALHRTLRNYESLGSLGLSAVFRAVQVVSSALAQMPISVYAIDEEGYRREMVADATRKMLMLGGDYRMTRFTLFEMLVRDLLLDGNAYAVIRRKGGKPSGLFYVRPVDVQIFVDAYKTRIEYRVNSFEGIIKPADIIHLINVSNDGIKGEGVMSYALRTIDIANAAENTAAGYFAGTGRHTGFITSDKRLNKEQRDEVAAKVESGAPGSVFVLEGGFDFHSMGIDPAAAQLLQSREFSVVEIARFFGVSPVKLFDLSKSSYATVEATQLAFLTDTLAPLMAKIETELERKLYPGRVDVDVAFSTDVLLRADKTTQAGYLQNLVTNGIISPNEARKQLDLPPVEGGDEVKMQVNMGNLSEIGKNLTNTGNNE